MYVALTRASHAMYLVVDGGENNSMAKWLLDVLKDGGGDEYVAPPEFAGVGGHVVYCKGDPRWYGAIQPAVATLAGAQAPQPRALGETLGTRVARHRRYLAPSAHAARSSAVYFREHSPEAAQRGTVLHALFEQVTWLDDPAHPLDEARLHAALHRVAPGLDALASARFIGEFRQAIARAEIKRLLQKPAEPCEVKTELRFAELVQDGLVCGALDRVVFYPNATAPERIEIIDYKSDNVRTPAEIAAREESYAPQLELYRKALQAGCGVPLKNIHAQLLFICAATAVS